MPVNVPCYEFDGDAALRSDTLFVVIVASTNFLPRACQQVLSTYRIVARVHDVPSGRRPVVLIYRYEGMINFETRVTTLEVLVPE